MNSKLPPQNSKLPPQNSKLPPQNSKLPPQNSKLPPQNSKLLIPSNFSPFAKHVVDVVNHLDARLFVGHALGSEERSGGVPSELDPVAPRDDAQRARQHEHVASLLAHVVAPGRQAMRRVMHGLHAMQFHAVAAFVKPENVSYFSAVVLVVVPAHGLAAHESHALLVVVATGVGRPRFF